MERNTAIITGATSGIGAAYAEFYAKKGYNLIITGRRIKEINFLAKELEKKYEVSIDVNILDFSDIKLVNEFINKISEQTIDVLVNNAGFGYNSLFYKSDFLIYEKMIDTHISVPIKLIRAVLPNMIKRNIGTIINISSDGIYLLIPKNGVYAGSKSFLKTFTEALSLELIETNVHVQVVIPGLTKTAFHGKMGMDESNQKSKGIMRWMNPNDVVRFAMEELQKNKIICIPGFMNKLIIKIVNMMPRRMYYRLINNFAKKNFKNQDHGCKA